MPPREKIAILGAGPAGLAAAFGLSDSPELRERYDITIYQVGWRAGGKCSTGRAGPTNRIEQNGTHYLFGCYDNCFDTARRSYQELAQAGIDWFGRYEEAFLPRDLLVFKECFKGKWFLWPVYLPTNRIEPGTRDGRLGILDYTSMLLQLLVQIVLGGRLARWLRPQAPFEKKRPLWLRMLYALLKPLWVLISYLVAGLVLLIGTGLVRLLRLLGDEGLEGIVWLFRAWRTVGGGAVRGLGRHLLFFRRAFVAIDFQCALIIGLVRDGVFGPRGYGAIEQYEFREWLRRHGARDVTLYAPFVMTWYDSVAAYEEGNKERPNLSAGVSVMSIAKAALMYKGHFAYQMRAEIGDTFIAPILQCLRQRGVKVRFFHRVWDLVPDPDGTIGQIEMERQVDLTSGDPDSYQPFITVNGLKAWPNEPLWCQVATPPPAAPSDMDSYYTTWRGTRYTLRKGTDYDTVILAMPPDTFPTYCSRLLANPATPAWRRMVENLPAVETQSIRLWFHPTLAELGWTLDTPILSGYAKPFSTWEDNGSLVDVETWPAEHRPHAMATVFGALDAPRFAPSWEDTEYPLRQQAAADRHALVFMRHSIGPLWPGAASLADPVGVDWAKLVDLDNGVGAERMRSQYVRANSGPTERYTMARANTSQYRLPVDGSGYGNLILAGDWVQNRFLIGSVEGAIMAGLQASRAISGSPAVIPGEVTGL